MRHIITTITNHLNTLAALMAAGVDYRDMI